MFSLLSVDLSQDTHWSLMYTPNTVFWWGRWRLITSSIWFMSKLEWLCLMNSNGTTCYGVPYVLEISLSLACCCCCCCCFRNDLLLRYWLGCCFVAGFVACALQGSSLMCDFYGITQIKPVYSIQIEATWQITTAGSAYWLCCVLCTAGVFV